MRPSGSAFCALLKSSLHGALSAVTGEPGVPRVPAKR